MKGKFVCTLHQRRYAGLSPDHVDHTRPDIPDTYGGELLEEEEPGQIEDELRQEKPHVDGGVATNSDAPPAPEGQLQHASGHAPLQIPEAELKARDNNATHKPIPKAVQVFGCLYALRH